MRRIHVVPVLLGTLLGCAPGQHAPDRPRPGTPLSALTAEEIGQREWSSAYAAVAQLRPSLLLSRMGRPPLVFVDGMQRSIEELALIPAEVILEIRYVTGAEAVRFPGAANALLVTTHAGGDRR